MKLYSPKDFQKLRRAGKVASQCLDYIGQFVKPGVSTEELDKLCYEFIIAADCVPACLGYHGYPKSICTSVNDEICHGIPSPDVILREGDIVNIDVTVIKKGFYGDTSRMYTVGKCSKAAYDLVNTTEQCLMDAIAICKPGVSLAEIGRVIQSLAEGKGYSVVRDYCGHGIGTVFHDDPNVLHYYTKRMENVKLKEGMVFTIEPMINAGGWQGAGVGDDGWTDRTADGSLSAQFEHTLGITADGCEVFTISSEADE